MDPVYLCLFLATNTQDHNASIIIPFDQQSRQLALLTVIAAPALREGGCK